MVEILKSNTNELDKKLEKAIGGFKEEEKVLEEDVINYQDTEKIKSVEKTPDGKVIFPYTYGGYECTLILERKGNKVMVSFPEKTEGKSKIKLIPTYIGNPMNNEFEKGERKGLLNGKEIDASSSKNFLEELGGILNIIIDEDGKRLSVPKKGEEAYRLLFEEQKK